MRKNVCLGGYVSRFALSFVKHGFLQPKGSFQHSVGSENLSILIGKSRATFVPFQCTFYGIYQVLSYEQTDAAPPNIVAPAIIMVKYCCVRVYCSGVQTDEFPTTRNNVQQQGVQKDATCHPTICWELLAINVASVLNVILAASALGFEIRIPLP